ncbi:MAG: Ribonuclease HII [Firmicutes bacterium]|nr:Ribonuclease HII [candidate division NPL-UPA2 bacterium]
MFELENKYWAQGYSRILGMDEVGRGALAGPVTVGGVIWRQHVTGEGIRDSKALKPSERERVARYIRTEAEAFAIASRDQGYIDAHGIVQAIQSCQVEIIAKLNPDMLLLDAFLLPKAQCRVPQQAIVKGDQLSVSIAAASIVAKVDRDRMMCELDAQFPGLGLGSHKGYGTRGHYAALALYGPCYLHRKSFLRQWSRV